MRMRKIAFLLALCIGTLCCAKEYFVSTTGNDNGPGTSEQPFKTFKKAVSLVKPGDIVTARGGLYREQIEIRSSGTADKPIIFRGAPGETAMVSAGYAIGETWKKTPGYRFIYESKTPYAVSMLFDSILLNRYLAVEDMSLLDRQPGAYLVDKKTGKLYINTFSGRNPNSIGVVIVPWLGGKSSAGHSGGRTGSTLQHYSANVDDLYQWNKGFIVYGKHVIVENFHLTFWPGQGIRVNQPAEGVIVRNNTVVGGTCGIMLYGDVINCKIINNRVYRVAGTGIQLTGSGEKCLVKGNYVFTCGTCSPFKGAKDGSSGNVFNIAHYGSYRNTDIIDNTVVSVDFERCSDTLMRNKGAIRQFTTQTGNVFYGGGVSLYAAEKSSALLANNTCFGGDISIGVLKSGNKYTPTIKDNLFIKKSAQDPRFADVYHRDFRLQPDSPHLGKGAFPKPGNVLYVKPGAKGTGATSGKPADFAAALKKSGSEALTIYMLPGTYTGKAVISGVIKLANYEGGKVIIDKGAFSGKGKVTVDGIIFRNSTLDIAGDLLVKRSVFDSSKVKAAAVVMENDTFRNSSVAGKVIMRNSFVCGSGNTFAAAGMVSENNCFNNKQALAAFQGKVKEAHKSFFRSVKLDTDYTLPAGDVLACSGLDCSTIGGQPVKKFEQPLKIENLQVRQLSADSALVSWATPRHYCNVNVRVKCVETKKNFFAGSCNQGRLRSCLGQVRIQGIEPGKTYVISCHFYPINKDPMVTREITFKVPAGFTHTPATLQVAADGSAPFRTISDALLKAGPGDTIIVAPGVYTEEIDVNLSGVTIKSKVPGKAFLNVANLLNYAIKVNGASDVTVEGFHFIGLPYSSAARTLHIVRTKNFTVRNCFFHRPDKGRGVSNIQFLGHSPDGVLVENCVFDSGFHGIWLYPANNVTIRNCSFYGNGVNAIHVGCEKGWKTQIYNNIFQDTTSNHHSAAVTVATFGDHVYCDYNIYWRTNRAPKQRYFAFGRHRSSPTYSAPWTYLKKDMPETLKGVQERYGLERHAVEADPLFADITKADFTLKPGSPAFKKGKDGKNIGADFSIFK